MAVALLRSSAGGPLLFGADSVGASATTRYLYAGNAEGLAEIDPNFLTITNAGTLRNLYVRQDIPAGNGNFIVYRVRVNTVATLLLVSITSVGTSASNLVDKVPVVAGDVVDVQVVKVSSVGSAPRNVKVTLEVA